MRALLPLLLLACADPEVPEAQVDPCAPVALPGEGAVGEDDAEALRALLDRYVATSGGPGAVLGVRLPDGGVWVGAAGLRAAEHEAPVATGDAFALGSITKTFVAVLILRLVDDGLLDLDESVSPWFGGVVAHAEAITPRLLLAHGSGLRDYTETPAFRQMLLDGGGTPPTVDEVIALAAAAGPDFPPGERFSYSNSGFHVLGRIAEEVTGQDLATLLRTRVTGPAGLRRTWLMGFEEPPACAALVEGHLGLRPAFPIPPAWQWGAGGLASDARDLLRWLDGLLGGDVVTAEERALLTTPTDLRDAAGRPSGYGLGVRVRQLPCGEAVGHTGSTMGFQSDAFRAGGVDVVALQNDFFLEVSDLAYEACEALVR